MSLDTHAIRVRHLGGDRLGISVRGHELIADQPVEEGGEDRAPTPTELFLVSLASCVAFYAERFLRRRNVSTAGLLVSCDWTWAREPLRVGGIAMTVEAPTLTPELRLALEHVIERCPIHNTLRQPPQVRFNVLAAQPVGS